MVYYEPGYYFMLLEIIVGTTRKLQNMGSPLVTLSATLVFHDTNSPFFIDCYDIPRVYSTWPLFYFTMILSKKITS